jgi:hypothetical protein
MRNSSSSSGDALAVVMAAIVGVHSAAQVTAASGGSWRRASVRVAGADRDGGSSRAVLGPQNTMHQHIIILHLRDMSLVTLSH